MKLIIAWAFCIVFFCAQSAAARTITVGPGRDFAKIQPAIDAATTGDTIIVYPGVYVENIVIAKDIILRSTSPTDSAIVAATIIDGNGSGSVVGFSGFISKECVLSGFTIQNGDTIAYPGGGASGGGISGWLPQATGGRCEARIENNVITGNVATFDGGGIAACHGTIANNTIKGNISTNGAGAGIAVCDGTIERNIIYGNSAAWGSGGISECNGTIQNNLIVKNVGDSALFGCDGIIRNNIIALTLNVQPPQHQRAAALYGCIYATIENNAILFNFGEGVTFGGGLYHCMGVVRNCIIWGNKPSQLEDSTTPMYSCIEGWTGGGVGNIAADPLISTGAFEDVPFTYTMSPSSPCVDAGNPAPQFNDAVRPPGQGTERNDMGAYGGPNNNGWFLGRFVTIRTPNGGGTFSAGTLQEIRWDSAPWIKKVNVFFTYRTASVQTETLATNLANAGTMRWQIPSFAAEDCSIRVVDSDDPATSDTSDGPFRIVSQPPTFQVQSPNGGEAYFWGGYWPDTIPIRWTSTGASQWVGIHQTTDGGKTWNLLVAETPNDGAYDWPAPHVNSDQCRVSVFDVAVPAYDMSDAGFFIFSDPAAILPNLRITGADFSPAAPAQMKPGDPLVVSALVENLGLTASGPCWFEVFGSRTGGITLDQFLCDSVRLDAIAGKGSFSLNMTKPLASIPDGPYTVVYVVDRLNEVPETMEWDNRAVVASKRLLTIRPPTGANLTIEDFGIGPNPVVNGQPITLGGWVRNTGTQDSGPFWIEFWGSMNRVFPQLDFMLCDSIYILNLPAGQSIFLGYFSSKSLYACPTGTFMAGVYVDRPDAVNETNETDNYAFVDGIGFNQSPTVPPRDAEVHLLAGPDLVVVNSDFSPAAPTAIAPGAPIQISTRIENRGASDSGPFWLEFWGSKLGGLSLNDFIGDSIFVANIAPGGAFDVSRSVALYSMPDGPYTFTVVADRLGAVADVNPRNNRLAVAGKRVLTIRPQTQANLRTENFAVTTTTLQRSQPIPMTGQVRNVGTQDSGPFWIEFWGSFNQMYPDLNFYLCNSIYVPNLAAGAALDLAANPRTLYSNLSTGPCMFLCFPDRPDFVNETDESDNVGAIAGGLIAP
jgi:hypothetical protein